MNVITVASRKGGAGKTTLCAHLAAYAYRARAAAAWSSTPIRRARWRSAIRCAASRALPFATAERGIERALTLAAAGGVEWAFIDTAPSLWVVVQEAIRAATLVLIPARPGFLDLAAVRETVKAARECDKPYAVVLNACPVKRDDKEAPVVAQSRVLSRQAHDPGLVRPGQPARGVLAVARQWRKRGRSRCAFARGRRDRAACGARSSAASRAINDAHAEAQGGGVAGRASGTMSA